MSNDLDAVPGWIPMPERRARPVNRKTIRNPNTRYRRNDPCPCGAPRKWKDCHGKP